MKAVIFARGYDLHGQVEKCKEYADMITVDENVKKSRISSVATNKLY